VGLLDKIVNQTWSTNNKKLYTNKGYIFTHFKDVFEVKVEDLSDGNNVHVKVKCDGCDKGSSEEWKIPWNNYKKSIRENGEYYCHKCSNSLFVAPFLRLTNKDVKEIIHKNLGEYWTINQIKIDPISNKTLVDLIDENKYLYSNIPTNSIQQGHVPFKFHKSNIFVNKNINHFLELNNRKYRLLENNNYENNSKKLEWFCFDCKKIFKTNLATIQQQPNYQCPHCGDNISYPNKLFRAMLEQLNEDYTPEYNPDWIKPKRYDFKLNNKKYIVEMDGGLGHGKKNTLNGQTEEETKAIDDYKDDEALKHNEYVIRIDSTKSDLKFIKNNIMNSSLPDILNFKESDIYWQKCHEFACNSLVKVVCDLWNEGLNNISEIVKKLKLDRSTVIKYLKQGVELDWCNYNSKEQMIINGNKGKGNFRFNFGGHNKKEVYQKTLDGVVINKYISASEACRMTGINHISSCCRGERNFAGGFKWEYSSEYIKSNPIPTAI